MLDTARQLERLAVSAVPAGWQLATVGTSCTIRNELRLPLAVEVRASMAGEYPYYGPTGVLGHINECRVDGDFALIGEDGDHFLDVDAKPQTLRIHGKCNVNNHAHIVGAGPQCTVDWFFYFFQHRDIFHSLTRQGAGRFKLTKAALELLPILLPPLPEQRKIAEILRTWDEAIEACERLIAKLSARQLALVHQLVFGERRLGNFSRSNETHKERWLTVPTDWPVVSIGSIAEERSDVNRNGGAAEVLSCSKHDGFVRSLEYFKKQVFSSDLSGYKLIRRGDFGFPSNHVEEGSIGLQNLVDEGLVSPIYTVFRFDPGRVDNDYAYSVLKTELYRHIFQVSTSASVDRRGSLRWSDFSMLPFPLPPINEQRAIQKVLSSARSQIDQQRLEREALMKQKRGLMQKLLTGAWRVKVDA